MALAIEHLMTRSDHQDHQNGAVLGHLMDIKERLAIQESRATTPSVPPAVVPWDEWLKAVKELSTAGVWLATMGLGLAHWLGWIDATKMKALLGLLSGGPAP